MRVLVDLRGVTLLAGLLFVPTKMEEPDWVVLRPSMLGTRVRDVKFRPLVEARR